MCTHFLAFRANNGKTGEEGNFFLKKKRKKRKYFEHETAQLNLLCFGLSGGRENLFSTSNHSKLQIRKKVAI